MVETRKAGVGEEAAMAASKRRPRQAEGDVSRRRHWTGRDRRQETSRDVRQ